MKKGTIIILLMILGVFLVIGVFFNADFFFTSQKELKNVENSKGLYVGMTEEQVLKQMGQADAVDVRSSVIYGNKSLFYQPPFGAAEGIKIYLDTIENKVVRIISSN